MIIVPILALYHPDTQEFLLTRRLKGKEFGGYLEFPGGKCEKNESATKGLKREILEELGIIIQEQDLIPITFNQTHHNGNTYLLMLFYCEQYAGTAKGQEGQEIVMIHQDYLIKQSMPPANKAMIKRLNQFMC